MDDTLIPQSHELRVGVDGSQLADEDGRRALQSLPPVDGGRAAWLLLAGSFMIECLLWGFPFSFGVLQDYYTTTPPISRNPTNVSAVGTTCSGIMYLAAPLSFAALQRWPKFGRTSLFYGLPVVVVAIALSSFATEVWHLILTQGVLYGIGGGFLYYPIFLYLDEWFVRRKAVAYGILWAGSGSGGLCGPMVLNWGLAKYGAETFLRGWAVALLVLIGPLLFFVRPRLPPTRHNNPTSRTIVAGFGFVKTRAFWALQIGNIIQGLGYFIPILYLPTYARHVSLSPTLSSLLPALVSISSIPGLLFLTYLSDHAHPVYTLILISSLGSTLSIFLLWGLAGSSLPLLLIFSIAYGFFAGGFTGTYAGAAKELKRVTVGGESGRAEIGSIFGLISLGRGVGNVICGPVSEGLLRLTKDGYGNGFGPLIVFTGVTAALTMGSWVGRRLKVV